MSDNRLVWVNVTPPYRASKTWWLVNEDRECMATVTQQFGIGIAEYAGREFLDLESAKAVAMREALARSGVVERTEWSPET